VNRIIFEKAALADFKAANEYYDDIDKKLGDKLYRRLWQTLDYIKEYPLHFPKRYRDIRIARTAIFPYGVHYLVENEWLLVLRILHHKQYYA